MRKKKPDNPWAELRQRVSDVVAGACGAHDPNAVLGGPELSRIVPALEDLFGCTEEGKKNLYLFGVHNLDNYTDVDDITNFLFDRGVRA